MNRQGLATAALLAAGTLVAPATVMAQEAEWVIVKNPGETFQIQVPPGYTEEEKNDANRLATLQYSWDALQNSRIEINVYDWPATPQSLADAMLRRLKGATGNDIEEYLNEERTRFELRSASPDQKYFNMVECRVEGKLGYQLNVMIHREIFEGKRELVERIVNSFKVYPPPQDSYLVPEGWKEVKGTFFAVMGPVATAGDEAAKAEFDRRLYRISTWIDGTPHFQMLRDFFLDQRKMMARMVIHVHPNRDEFRRAAGDMYREDRNAVFLPFHPEHPVMVDGSPAGTLTQADLVAAVGIQYMETRIPPLVPWMRAAFEIYWQEASTADRRPGIFRKKLLDRAKDVFKGKTPELEALAGMDRMNFEALGEDGRIAAWGILQYGMHGPDEQVRNFFRGFFRAAVGKSDLASFWNEWFAEYTAGLKKKLKLKDIDNGAKKYIKDFRLDK